MAVAPSLARAAWARAGWPGARCRAPWRLYFPVCFHRLTCKKRSQCYTNSTGGALPPRGGAGGRPPAGRFPGAGQPWGLPCPLLLPLLASFPFPLLSPGAWCCVRTVPGRCGPGVPCVAVTVLRPLACFCPRLRAAWPCGWPLARVISVGPLMCALVSVARCGGLARWPPPRRPGVVRSCCLRTPPPPLAAPPWRALIVPWRCKAPSCCWPLPAGGPLPGGCYV